MRGVSEEILTSISKIPLFSPSSFKRGLREFCATTVAEREVEAIARNSGANFVYVSRAMVFYHEIRENHEKFYRSTVSAQAQVFQC